jgi:hypothetical protein
MPIIVLMTPKDCIIAAWVPEKPRCQYARNPTGQPELHVQECDAIQRQTVTPRI